MLVNCMVYCQGEQFGDIELDQLGDYLHLPDHFVWIALRDTHAAELAELQQLFNLPELAVDAVLHGQQSPNIEEYGDSLFATMQLIDVTGGQLSLGEVAIFVGEHYVLSVRQHSRQGFSNVRARCENEPHLLKQGPAFVFYALIDAIIDRYFQALLVLEYELEQIEETIFTVGFSARRLNACIN